MNKIHAPQISAKKAVFEKHYRGQFSCSTFSESLFESCKSKPDETVADPAAELAAHQYAADNVAILKIFIK